MKLQAKEIRVTAGVYPSGTPYLIVAAGEEIVGSVHRVEGGYVPWGCKKPRSIEAAVRDVILTRIRIHNAAIEKFALMLELPLKVDQA